MSGSHRRRARVPALAFGLSALLAATFATPVLAASDPAGAVQDLVDRIAAGELETLDEVVCAEYQESVRAQFDPASQLGELPEGMDLGALLDSLTVEIADSTVEVLSQDAESAVVRLTGSMTVGFMGMSETEEVDEEVEVVLEDGSWLVCDDLLGAFSGDDGTSGTISSEGVCAVLSLDELNALGEPQFGSSFSGFDSCTYQSASFDDFLSLTIVLQPGQLDDYSTVFPEGTELVVAGHPAYAAQGQLWVELEDGLLLAQLYSDTPSDASDPELVAYLQAVLELALPRVPDVERFDPSAFEPPDIAEPSLEPEVVIDYCAALPIDELNALSPLQYDTAEGSFGSCTFTNATGTAGFHFVTIGVSEGTSAELRPLFPDGQDVTVAGQAAYWALEQLWVDTEDGLLTVSAFPFGSPGSEELVTLDYASAIAEIVLARLPEIGAAGGG